MAQRTVFPQIPNTAEAQYPNILQLLFGELQRRGGTVRFKAFRPWLKERNIYNKEEVEELFTFLGCQAKPEFVLGDFARQYLDCSTPAARQALLYRWVFAWNPFLVKYVFEALDVDGGGRLHSTHELYRLITSYVYPGEYVTLPDFQNWIRWMAATGYIKYIGIRWGLSEIGRAEMKNIRMIDVDEMLEDEEEAEEERLAAEAAAAEAAPTEAAPAGEEAPAAPEAAAPDTPTVETGPAPIPAVDAPPVAPPADAELDEELPDMPPEAPVPQWEAPVEVEAPAPASEPAVGSGLGSPGPVTIPAPTGGLHAGPDAVNAWLGAYPRSEGAALAHLGLDAKAYKAAPELFLFKAGVAAVLAARHPGSVWGPFYRYLAGSGFFDRYFGQGLPIEQVIADLGWFVDRDDHRALFGEIALPLMVARAGIKSHRGLTRKLEVLSDAPRTLKLLCDTVFGGRVSAAPLWLLREMVVLGLWRNPGFPG